MTVGRRHAARGGRGPGPDGLRPELDGLRAVPTGPGRSSLGLTVAGVVVGLRISVPGGIAPVNVVAFGLTLAWALVGFVVVRTPGPRRAHSSPRTTSSPASTPWSPPIALAAGRKAVALHAWSGARDLATIAAIEVTAISFHFLLALPDGRLRDTARRAAGGVGLRRRARRRDRIHRGPPALHGCRRCRQLDRGRGSWRSRRCGLATSAPSAPCRERMDWFGIGVTLAATVTLVATVLHLLVGWPGPLGAVSAGATVLVPLGLLAGESRKIGPHGSRGLVQVLAIFGFVVVVSAIYLIVVLGLGHAPKTTGDKEALALSMVASGVAALIFVPARARFLESATRFVYGSREAPDEVLRTFGSRLTRAIPMDELLLQLAESLRKTMDLPECGGLHGNRRGSGTEGIACPTSVPARSSSPRASGRSSPAPACRARAWASSGCRRCSTGATTSRSGWLRSATGVSCWA